MNQNNAEKLSKIFGSKRLIPDFISNVMKCHLKCDDIKFGIHQEVMRKLKLCAIDRNNIPRETFYKYGLTNEELELLTHK